MRGMPRRAQAKESSGGTVQLSTGNRKLSGGKDLIDHFARGFYLKVIDVPLFAEKNHSSGMRMLSKRRDFYLCDGEAG